MTQIKIFEGNGNNESDINEWLKSNTDITVVGINHTMMHELYDYAPNQICNQWIVSTVIYKEESENELL